MQTIDRYSSFLPESGVMSERIRSYDWARTPLGPLEEWPQSLQTTVSLILSAPFPIIIGWGPEQTVIHNDAYMPLLGDRPEALGRRYLDVWSDAGDVVRPLVKQALAGESSSFCDVRFDDMPPPFDQPSWFDYSFSPLRDENGAIVGLVNIVMEKTEAVNARAALEESEAQLQRVLKEAPVIIAVHEGPDHRYIYSNPHNDRAAGYRNLLGKPLGEALPEIIGQGVLERFDHVYKNGEPLSVPELNVAFPLRTGEAPQQFWFRHELRPWRNAEGKVAGVLSFAYDITEQVKAREAMRESEERFRVMADHLPLIIWVHDAEGRQIYINQTFRKWFGITEEASMGSGWQIVVHPDDAETYVGEFLDCVRQRKPFHSEVRTKMADGDWHWLESWGQPRFSESGEYLGFIGTSADITDRKEAESNIKRINETLEQRIAERTAEAEVRARQLQKLALELSNAEDRERKRIATILHDDVQQYLAAVRFHLQMMRQKNQQEILEQGIPRMEKIIDESIAKCRGLSHELSPPVLHQNGLLAALEWLAQDTEEKHGVKVELELHPEAEPECPALASLLYRSVRELLFNCVKHAEAESAAVEATGEDGWVHLAVQDGGIGCDLSSLNDSEDQIGFGLFTIKERIHTLGGQFEIESTPGAGFGVNLSVPKNGKPKKVDSSNGDEIRRAEMRKAELVREDQVLRILVADDHAVIRDGLINLLDDEKDFRVVASASNGAEAVAMAKELHPDVVVMDISMPLKDGIAATAEIKAAMPDIGIVGLSMHVDPTTESRMRKAGASAYVYKTSPSDVLVKAVRDASE